MLLVIIVLLIILIIIMTLQIKLYIEINKNKLNLILKFYILKKILVGKIDLKNRKKKKHKKIKNTTNDRKSTLKFIYKTIKESNLNLEKLNLKVDVCTTDPILTSYLVMIISNIVTFCLRKANLKINYKNCKYDINPLYINKKILNVKLNCIISSNNVHSIYIIYKNFRKWRCDINGRGTSNRKSYANSNE
ncbi:MAG: hypothetical protein J6K42_06365 [Clostridia bacterium]|nr:hypothetical protein [Clostridia bacterium]